MKTACRPFACRSHAGPPEITSLQWTFKSHWQHNQLKKKLDGLETDMRNKLPSFHTSGLQNSAPESFHVKFWAAALQLVKALRLRAPPPFVVGSPDKKNILQMYEKVIDILTLSLFNMFSTRNLHYGIILLISLISYAKLKEPCADVLKLKILPGFGWDALKDKDTKQLLQTEYSSRLHPTKIQQF
uniref:Uncharacterized protein n=1 Tax=Strigamia maritima TaxID=126957 RepID=T1JHY2_STRMM